jgi:hypothetical protein
MAKQTSGVVGGVDAHADEHHVAVVDLQGRLLGATAFPTTAAGYALLSSWLRGHGEVERVGVESQAPTQRRLCVRYVGTGSGSSR